MRSREGGLGQGWYGNPGPLRGEASRLPQRWLLRVTRDAPEERAGTEPLAQIIAGALFVHAQSCGV